MECSVCLRNWNSENCIPKSLPCGHSFCVQCLNLIFTKHKTAIICPTCITTHKMNSSQLSSLPKNFSLLALVRDKTSEAKEPEGVKDVKAKDEKIREKGVKEVDQSLIEKEVTLKPYCGIHKMLLHSFVPGTGQLLCDKCITELPKSITSIVPIRKVIVRDYQVGYKRFKATINTSKEYNSIKKE